TGLSRDCSDSRPDRKLGQVAVVPCQSQREAAARAVFRRCADHGGIRAGESTMNCEQALEWFGIYGDLTENDESRTALETHIMECSECAEEFRMWEESAAMVRSLRMDAAPPVYESDVQRSVMARIYAEDSWYLPVKERTYQWSASFRRGAA